MDDKLFEGEISECSGWYLILSKKTGPIFGPKKK